MYGKIFNTLFSGSMIGAGAHIFAVWSFCLACKDSEGDVELNPKFLSMVIGCEEEEITTAIKFLTKEDKKSRSKNEEGCRLSHLGGFLYSVVNAKAYTKIQDKEALKRYWKEAKTKSRNVKDDGKTSENISDVSISTSTSIKKKGGAGGKKKFKPPTPEEAQAYLDEKSETRFTGEEFVDANIAKGWVVGTTKTPMKDWKAVVRTWISNRKKDEKVSSKVRTGEDYDW